MPSTLFHFDCRAVVSVEVDEDGEPDFVELRGLFSDQKAVDRFIGEAEEARAKAHQEQWNKWKPVVREAPPMTPVHYAVIPLNHVTAKSLCDLEDKLEAAAKLQVTGVGAQIGGAA